MTLPAGTSVTPFERKRAELHAGDLSEAWYRHAVKTLRGGDGGEHGILLYKLLHQRSDSGHPLVILDIGTARGFSALTLARALLDTNISGHVYSADIIAHHQARNWHGDKHRADEPLAGLEISRSEIWNRWFPAEAARVTALTAQSADVLDKWERGPVDIAFLDGRHTRANVKKELALLDPLMREGGIIVLDDYHLGVSAVHIRSRLLNLIAHALAKALPSAGKLRPGLGKDNEFVVVKQRFSGIRHAVREFLEERQGRWALEIIPMPTRGEYQGDDYALALLTRTQQTEGRAIP